MGEQVEASGPDLIEEGVAASELPEGGIVSGRANGEPVVLVRCRGNAYAVGATCTHYGGPLAEGIVEGGTIRCPWHHARFDIATGRAENPPALNPIPCYRVEQRGERLYVLGREDAQLRARVAGAPSSVAIVGSGAAGAAVADGLRRGGYEGPITLIGDDPDDPVDRPNLSKDYLAGNAPEEWIPLRPPEHFASQRIELLRGRVTAVRTGELTLGERRLSAEAIVLATGAEPIRLPIPGADGPHVFVVRTLGDTRRLIERASSAKRAVIIGAGFIGLETAASLVARGLEVHVVGRETLPLERVLGRELGELVRDVHLQKGVRLHLGATPTAIDEHSVTLDNGTRLPADLVVMGVGVRPRVALAEGAGLAIDRGIVVDAEFRTSAPSVWACGDAARFPDARTGERIRVEHWVVAEQQGYAVAASILGHHAPFRAVPFFWSAHHDVTINYVGHAESFDRVDVAGSVRGRDCAVAYRRGDRTLAVATVGRDRDSLRAEAAIESGDEAALRELIPYGSK